MSRLIAKDSSKRLKICQTIKESSCNHKLQKCKVRIKSPHAVSRDAAFFELISLDRSELSNKIKNFPFFIPSINKSKKIKQIIIIAIDKNLIISLRSKINLN